MKRCDIKARHTFTLNCLFAVMLLLCSVCGYSGNLAFPEGPAFGYDAFGVLSGKAASGQVQPKETDDFNNLFNIWNKAILHSIAASRSQQQIDFGIYDDKYEYEHPHNLNKKYIIIINEFGEWEYIPVTFDHSQLLYTYQPQLAPVTVSDRVHSAIDMSIIVDIDPETMGIISLPGEKPKCDQKASESDQQSKDDSGQDSHSEDRPPSSKKPKLIPLPLADVNLKARRQRLLTQHLSLESQSVRHYVKGAELVEGCKPGKLSLKQVDVKETRLITGQGHRCTLSVKFKNDAGETRKRKWVLKLTDEGYQDWLTLYQDDITLSSFKQALNDVLSFINFKKKFIRERQEKADRVLFPVTRLAIVSFQDYIDLLMELLNPDGTETVFDALPATLRPLYIIDQTFHSGYVFLVVQEFIDLKPLCEADFDHFKAEIEFLSTHIQDINMEGRNLMIEASTGRLVVLDIESNQLTTQYYFESVDGTGEASLDSLNPEIISELAGLPYEPISEGHRQSIRHSIGIDSAFISDFDSPPSSLGSENPHAMFFPKVFSVDESNDSGEGEED